MASVYGSELQVATAFRGLIGIGLSLGRVPEVGATPGPFDKRGVEAESSPAWVGRPRDGVDPTLRSKLLIALLLGYTLKTAVLLA